MDAIGGTGAGGTEVVRGRGGLLVLPELRLGSVRWEQLEDEVLDLCDDLDALEAATGRVLSPGDVLANEDHLEIAMMRTEDEVVCDGTGGNRYSLVAEGGRWPARPTAKEGLRLYGQWRSRLSSYSKRFPDGLLLGYNGDFKQEFPVTERDEVVVLEETVTVRDGVVRGLVHNLSRTLYARDLTVTAQAPDFEEGDGGADGVWRWPLTVQPGERAPFEIAGWEGSTEAEMIDLSVTASFSPEMDIGRSINLHQGKYMDALYGTCHFSGELWVPTTPPGMASQVLGQTIDDLAVYVAHLEDGRLLDLEELATQTLAHYGEDNQHLTAVELTIDSYPVTADILPIALAPGEDLFFEIPGVYPSFYGVYKSKGNGYQLWAGGTPPPSGQQPVG